MSRLFIAVVVAAAFASTAFAQAKPVKPLGQVKPPHKSYKEPKCCQNKKCHHSAGEDKHHKCNKFCHDSHQKKGSCCTPHTHKKK